MKKHKSSKKPTIRKILVCLSIVFIIYLWAFTGAGTNLTQRYYHNLGLVTVSLETLLKESLECNRDDKTCSEALVPHANSNSPLKIEFGSVAAQRAGKRSNNYAHPTTRINHRQLFGVSFNVGHNRGDWGFCYPGRSHQRKAKSYRLQIEASVRSFAIPSWMQKPLDW